MANWEQVTRREAIAAGIDPDLYARQIGQESNFDPNARSPAGALGIAQFMPGTAAGLHINPLNPRQALRGGARLMASYIRKYGSYRNALIAYNAGPGALGKPLPTETQKYIATILRGEDGPGGHPSTHPMTETITTIAPRVVSDLQGALAAALFSHSKNPLLAAQYNVLSGQFTKTIPGSRSVSLSGGQGASVAPGDFVSRANRIEAAHPRYLWGGGHGPHPAALGAPVDCSGAVAQVLGISPRTSGDFGTVGKPGRGNVNIFYNGHHVFLEINGHFFGTSRSNPGGGAGWIPASQINSAYLRNFKVRHVA